MSLQPFNHPWVSEVYKPIYVLRFPETFTEEEFVDYFENHVHPWIVAAEEPYAWVLHTIKLSAKDRGRIATWQSLRIPYERKYCACYAFCIDNLVLRNMITALMWLSPPPVPTETFVSQDKAVAWCRSMIANHGIKSRAG